MGKLFGTDGIRGEANVEPMTPDMALRLGRALASHFCADKHHRKNRKPRIVIGKDTRISGYMFEHALGAGINAMGADVWFTGPLPTPGIAFITRSMRADAGVVISASHNPYYDNGIKVFGADGFKLPDETEAAIERDVFGDVYAHTGARRSEIGKAYTLGEAWSRYVEFIKSSMPDGLALDGLKVVVDCAHGAAYRVAPAVFEELGADVEVIANKPDGTNINKRVGSTHPQLMCEVVRASGADIGVALDGDADRCIIADEHGNVVDGDQVLGLCAAKMHREGELSNNTVVATVMSNLGLELALKRSGIKLIRTQVGDRHVVAEMRRGGFNLGGEQSGHLVFLDHTTTGDGVIAALKVMRVMLQEDRPLSQLARVIERVPQVLINVKVSSKPEWSELPMVSRLVSEVEAKLGEEGRVLLRYSGTEPKARVMVEGTDQRVIEGYADAIAGAVRAEIGAQ